ncbi:hypothetical protein [Dapis sp. BLCC M172]|uniref:hypothetical protein n=1 Tax=Dapis sp. BLCC M172 TaxID=2975281 RepID=UPI003CE9D6C1
MGRFKISDLSFYETIGDIEIQGGLFYYRNFSNLRNLLFPSLSIYGFYPPTLTNYFSEEKEGFLAEEFRENNGGYIYHRPFSTQDHKTQITLEVKRTGNSNSIWGHMTSYTYH